VAQCGGEGNIATLQRVLAEMGYADRGVHHFAGPATTAARLEAAGFTGIETWLSDEPTAFAPGEPFETYLETICLGDLVQPLDPADRRAFVTEVARRMPAPELDYVRLNIVATRA
jgi:trans-aconitate 2-methyltransferase